MRGVPSEVNTLSGCCCCCLYCCSYGRLVNYTWLLLSERVLAASSSRDRQHCCERVRGVPSEVNTLSGCCCCCYLYRCSYGRLLNYTWLLLSERVLASSSRDRQHHCQRMEWEGFPQRWTHCQDAAAAYTALVVMVNYTWLLLSERDLASSSRDRQHHCESGRRGVPSEVNTLSGCCCCLYCCSYGRLVNYTWLLAVELVKWLARLPSAQSTRVRFPVGAQKRKFISLLLSSASEGTVSRRSSRPRALVACVSCNWYTDLK